MGRFLLSSSFCEFKGAYQSENPQASILDYYSLDTGLNYCISQTLWTQRRSETPLRLRIKLLEPNLSSLRGATSQAS